MPVSASSERARQARGRTDPAGAPDPPNWTGQRESRTLRSPGNAGRGLRGSRRPPQPSDFGSVARTGPASPRPGSPVASGALSPPDYCNTEPGGRGGRFFLPPSLECRGPAPSHRPDVSGHRSEDLPEARSRRVQREKSTLGEPWGAPILVLGLGPRRCLEERPVPPFSGAALLQFRSLSSAVHIWSPLHIWKNLTTVPLQVRLHLETSAFVTA